MLVVFGVWEVKVGGEGGGGGRGEIEDRNEKRTGGSLRKVKGGQ
jgi:hypothetical protein